MKNRDRSNNFFFINPILPLPLQSSLSFLLTFHHIIYTIYLSFIYDLPMLLCNYEISGSCFSRKSHPSLHLLLPILNSASLLFISLNIKQHYYYYCYQFTHPCMMILVPFSSNLHLLILVFYSFSIILLLMIIYLVKHWLRGASEFYGVIMGDYYYYSSQHTSSVFRLSTLHLWKLTLTFS